MKKDSARIGLLDALRGFAILLMVLFHIFFDLVTFFNLDFNIYQGPIFMIGRLAALLFIGLSGYLTPILYNKYETAEFAIKNLKRGGRLIGIGMFISAITYILFPANAIWFGILHFIGVAILIGPLFLKRPILYAIGIPAILILGTLFDMTETVTYLALPLGLRPADFSSFDYYPLLPWLAVYLSGQLLSEILNNKEIQNLGIPGVFKPLSAIGRHSLMIYLIHQPLILGVLHLLL
jgi:uncharacterized membrane protein